MDETSASIRPLGPDWFRAPVQLDARSASIIATGMRAVARADGVIHQRELNLIASFEASIPAGTTGSGKLGDAEVEDAFLWSLYMTALADGVISDAERDCIAELAETHGIDPDRLEVAELEVKRKFLSVFAGVSFFRDSVVRVAKDLGLPESELEALAQEA
ncbi:MAG: hypothetical protein H6738_07165 [Alphaproteobacteria bacterium]|nr:hypothetical protein [Alphaproteobacteria bacterium]MCB9696542.1 hypothetical protein [Alphaproteobacteria bacterium]